MGNEKQHLAEQAEAPIESSVLLSAMTDEEKRAAARFNETTADGEGYDVPKPMMKRLRELGLVRHCGGGYYEQTYAMLAIEDALNREYYGG